MGLVVTRGIAELAGVPTPHMDDVSAGTRTCSLFNAFCEIVHEARFF